MKKFMDRDFLLDNGTAKFLYENYAEKMPVFDYHCHLDAREIYEDKRFSTITEAWLKGDHYKWRLMRQFGVEEKYVTGDAEDYEKFLKYAEVVPYAIGNPIYHWTHLELKRFFGIEETLSPQTAASVYARANKTLQTLTARQMILKSNVKAIFTTDDPADDLKWHELLKKDRFAADVRPTFRPDKAISAENGGYGDYLKNLGRSCNAEIKSLSDLKKALSVRMDYFAAHGCVCADHSFGKVEYLPCTEEEAAAIFHRLLAGGGTDNVGLEKLKGNLVLFLGREYARRGWVQQYHIGALRNNSGRSFKELGPDAGFDAMNDLPFAENLAALLDALDRENSLPKTVLYCLNPKDNETLAALINCFQRGAGKMQFGSGWWFNDQKDGIERQMETLSQMALVSRFIGMLTDSRSFLSYTRHEYFRRILCNRFGRLIENGEYPADTAFVGRIVEDICYNNAVRYFGL